MRPHGTSKSDHVSRHSHGVAPSAGRRRGQSPGFDAAVKFAAIFRRVLLEPPVVGASAQDVGTWVRVLAYASEREDDLVPAFKTDREWISTTGSSLMEVGSATEAGLLTAEANGIRVYGFDHEGLAAVKAKRSNGALGGRPVTTAKPQVTDSITSPEPPSSPLLTLPFPDPIVREDDFTLFWKAFPKKKNKGDAEKAFKAERPPIADVLAALSWQRTSEDWSKERGKFIPYPGTYLRAKGWLDSQTIEIFPQNASQRPWKRPEAPSPVATKYTPPTGRCFPHGENPRCRTKTIVPNCPECREQQARTAGREGEPTSIEDLMPAWATKG